MVATDCDLVLLSFLTEEPLAMNAPCSCQEIPQRSHKSLVFVIRTCFFLSLRSFL